MQTTEILATFPVTFSLVALSDTLMSVSFLYGILMEI